MSDNIKQVSFHLPVEIINEIQAIKEKCNFNNQSMVIIKFFEEYLNFDADLKAKISLVSKAKGLDYKELVVGYIRKYIDKEMKSYGFIKAKHQKTAQAEEQLLEALQAAVTYYESLPAEKRVYLSPSAVHKFILMKDFKQKNMGVIKRFLASDETKFVREYHVRNNLKPKIQGYNAR